MRKLLDSDDACSFVGVDVFVKWDFCFVWDIFNLTDYGGYFLFLGKENEDFLEREHFKKVKTFHPVLILQMVAWWYRLGFSVKPEILSFFSPPHQNLPPTLPTTQLISR